MTVCPVCRAESSCKVYYQTDQWRVHRCPLCTHAWVVDDANPPTHTAFFWGEDVFDESCKRTRMYEDRLQWIERYKPFPRSWLDIGCGGGGMLRCAASAGYAIEGVEPSPAATVIALKMGIPVHKSDLYEALGKLSSSEYGVVSYFHVLEHVEDPVTELLLARQIMGSRSLLVIEVPFFDSLSWKLLRSRHRHFYRLHRSYFNLKSLSKLLHRTGYSIVKWRRAPYWISVDWLLMRIGMKSDVMHRILPRAIGKRLVRCDLGDILLVIGKKNSESPGYKR